MTPDEAPAKREFSLANLFSDLTREFSTLVRQETQLIKAEMSEKVADAMKEGRFVLVTCAAGKNRSGLIAGLALRKLGVDGKEAVKAIQKNRPGALSNPRFRKLVES